jgi:hypothetical protein
MKSYVLALVMTVGCTDPDPLVALRDGDLSLGVEDLSYPRPLTLDVVIDDGTGQVAIGLAQDESQHFTVVTSCTAASCM